MTQILVIGKSGQLAQAFQPLLPDATFLDRSQLDLSQPEKIGAIIGIYQPQIVINCAAYTAVDKAEEERELAMRVNGAAPQALAKACKNYGAKLVHYSTDYVFDGSGETPWREQDATRPINAYGASKRAGEEGIIAEGGEYFIFRTSWVYDAQGKNFLNTMLRLGAEREALNVVSDQMGAPSYAGHLAQATLQALEAAATQAQFPSGIYHMCNSGETSWHGFAARIFDVARKAGLPVVLSQLNPIASSEYPTPAARPHNSRLDCTKLATRLGVRLPDWQEGLTACMEEKIALHRRTA